MLFTPLVPLKDSFSPIEVSPDLDMSLKSSCVRARDLSSPAVSRLGYVSPIFTCQHSIRDLSSPAVSRLGYVSQIFTCQRQRLILSCCLQTRICLSNLHVSALETYPLLLSPDSDMSLKSSRVRARDLSSPAVSDSDMSLQSSRVSARELSSPAKALHACDAPQVLCSYAAIQTP